MLSILPQKSKLYHRLGWMIIVLAFILRAWGVTHGLSAHPDERHIIMTVSSLSWADLNPHSFAYGSLPFYLLFFLSEALSFLSPFWREYDGIFIIGRWLAVLTGVATVAPTMRLATTLGLTAWGGLIAGLFMACNIFHIQLSHFYTVDLLLTLSCLGALLAMIKLAKLGRRRDYILVSILIGVSLAIKISALVLTVPLGLSLLMRWYRNRGSHLAAPYTIGSGVLILLGSVITMVALAPYSLLDYSTFIQHTSEQIAMTQGRWRPPYTVQYANTQAFIYPLVQIRDYLLLPPLALASLIGLGLILWGIVRAPFRAWPSLIIISFAAALFMSVAPLDVKFPRYLLPLYPILICLAALCAELPLLFRRVLGFLRSVLPVGLAAYSLFFAVAFSRIYSEPHIYEQASGWIYQNVPAGSRIIGVHWDDKLPVSLQDKNPFQYRYNFEGPSNELPLYERDTPQKMATMAATLAQADYLVFPTARTYGSLPQLADEYNQSLSFLSRLFRGELGYSLEQSFKVRPQLFGYIFNDDQADESFTVYDHPKVLVYKNSERLSANEITARIEEQSPLLSREQFLALDSASPIPPSIRRSSLESLIVWFVILQLASLIFVPLGTRLFYQFPDRGYAISKGLSLLILGVSAWACGWFLKMPITGQLGWILTISLFFLSLLSWLQWSRRGFFAGLQHLFQSVYPSARIVESLFFVAFIVWCIIRSYSPEIFWGEKPMDSTFLTYFTRLTSLPPLDPWAAGNTISYYYGGVFLCALLHKMTGIDPAIGYNLALASIAALLCISTYGAIVWLIGRARLALAGASLLILAGTWELFRLSLLSYIEPRSTPHSFDLFWAASRILTSPAITEFPLWSFLFGDLHAHVIALPFVMIFLGLEIAALKGLSLPILRGLSWGALFSLNSWDFIGATIVWAACVLARLSLTRQGRSQLILSEIQTALSCAIVVLPFALSSVSTEIISFGLVHDGWVTLSQVGRHLGGIWLLSLIGTVVLLISGRRLTILQTLGALGLSALAWLPPLLVILSAAQAPEISWPLVAVVSFGIFIFALIALSSYEEVSLRYAALLGILSLYFVIGVEFFYLIDRMNTIFKFYNLIWSLSVLCAVSLFAKALQSLPQMSLSRLAVLAVLYVNCAVLLFGSATAIAIMMNFRRTAVDRPTLDGIRYLELTNRDEYQLISWMKNYIEGTPTILEAFGDAYGPFTRISMHTGLPTVLGWPHHVSQRGTPASEVMERRLAIEVIYRGPSLETAMTMISRYGVRYIVVSDLEERTYGSNGLQKFAAAANNFKPIAQFGRARLYAVINSSHTN